MMTEFTVILIDDHPIVTNGLIALLENQNNIKIVKQFNNATEALRYIEHNPVDIVITDYSMPQANGLTITKTIKQLHPATAIIVLSMHDDVATVKELITAGVDAYVLKKYSHTELIKAIQEVTQRRTFYSAEITTLMAKMLVTTREKPIISDREMDVLKLLMQEKSNKEIATILCISDRTVETHRKNIMHKMGVNTTIGIVKYVYDNKLL